MRCPARDLESFGGRTTWYFAPAMQQSANVPAHVGELLIRSSPGVSCRVAGFTMLFSGLGAQYHPSMLMAETLTHAWLNAHVLTVLIRVGPIACLNVSLLRFLVWPV
jgi:hypothetical protein